MGSGAKLAEGDESLVVVNEVTGKGKGKKGGKLGDDLNAHDDDHKKSATKRSMTSKQKKSKAPGHRDKDKATSENNMFLADIKESE